jgi:hypothetical protein
MENVFKKLRKNILVWLTHKLALPILKIIRKPALFPYSMEQLKALQPNTVGSDLYYFLTSKNLQLLPHYTKHDIKHIVLGYDTTEEGEVCLQCFMLGNGHVSFPVMATVAFGLVTMPSYFKKFVIAFKRGRQAIDLSQVNWLSLVNANTASIQYKIFNHA